MDVAVRPSRFLGAPPYSCRGELIRCLDDPWQTSFSYCHKATNSPKPGHRVEAALSVHVGEDFLVRGRLPPDSICVCHLTDTTNCIGECSRSRIDYRVHQYVPSPRNVILAGSRVAFVLRSFSLSENRRFLSQFSNRGSMSTQDCAAECVSGFATSLCRCRQSAAQLEPTASPRLRRPLFRPATCKA